MREGCDRDHVKQKAMIVLVHWGEKHSNLRPLINNEMDLSLYTKPADPVQELKTHS